MSRTMISSIVLAGLISVGGCKSNNASSVSEVPAPSPSGPITAQHDPSLGGPQPVALKGGKSPAGYDAGGDAFTLGTPGNPGATPLPAPTGGSGGNHLVRQGETLWSISKTHYGTGQRWKDIIAANPGLTPEKLRVGMAIVLP